MSETKHTPGPWRYNIETGYRKIDVVTAENANLIAELPFSGSMAPEANARLIAACPTMYAYIAKKAQDGDADATRILAAL